MAMCFSCGAQLSSGLKPGRSETCPACDADVHCCRNCEFYDPGSYNECRETQAERVLEKERSNFCDYFSFAQDSAGGIAVGPQQGRGGNPLDELFKK